jgi:uncharacterized protein YkwD
VLAALVAVIAALALLSPFVNAAISNNFEVSVLSGINAERVNASLSPLNSDPMLVNSSRLHSEDMAARGYTAQTTPEGVSYETRMLMAGYNFKAAGEDTISWTADTWSVWSLPVFGPAIANDDSIAKTIVDYWMTKSCPCNRENILGNYSDVGVGVSINGSTVYVTVDFGSK